MILPRRQPIALLYHAFARHAPANDPHSLVVTGTSFRAQLGALIDRGWTPVDLDGYLASRRRPKWKKEFLVTIDDGYRSVADVALPILLELRVPALLFVVPAAIGGTSSWMSDWGDEPLLDAEELRTLAAAGVELGVHGFDHRDLVGRSHEELRRQTVEARDLLHQVTGVRARSFAYPRGLWDESARCAVKSAGYSVAFSVFRDGGDTAVARIDVNAKDTLGVFKLKLLPGYRAVWNVAGGFPALRRMWRRAMERLAH